MASQKPRLKKS